MKFNRVGQGVAIVADGTSLQGHVNESYGKLVDTFGEPDTENDGYKTDAEWLLRFGDGTVATIYNYKDGTNYLGKDGLTPKEITDWHIGGHTEKAVELVKQALVS